MNEKLADIILEAARIALTMPGATPELVLTSMGQMPGMQEGFCQVCGRKKRPAVKRPPAGEYRPPWYIETES
jgi:hypothetical protein